MTVEVNNHDCIEFWESELAQVDNVLRVVQAEKEDAERVKNCITDWEGVLKVYWENVELTHKNAKSCSKKIWRLKKLTRRVKRLTKGTVDVTEMAYCMVLDYFKSMDKLKQDIANLITEIECLDNPDIVNSSLVLKNIKDLNTQVTAAKSTQSNTINAALEVMEKARGLDTSLGNAEGTNPTERSGLMWLLVMLQRMFRTDMRQPAVAGEGTSYGEGCHEPQNSCDASIEPKPVLPLEKDPYYEKTKKQYEKAQGEQDAAEETYDEASMKESQLLSAKASLVNAIREAKSAKSC